MQLPYINVPVILVNKKKLAKWFYKYNIQCEQITQLPYINVAIIFAQ